MHPVLSIVERYSAISAAPILNLHRHQDQSEGSSFRPLDCNGFVFYFEALRCYRGPNFACRSWKTFCSATES